MNHLPFEEWLLDEQPLTLEQQRDLDSHMRTCAYCAALARTEKVLRAPHMVAPMDGFTARFQTRLALQKSSERRSKLLGLVWFVLGGLAFLAWAAWSPIVVFLSSPAEWIAILVGWGVFLFTTLQALGEAGFVLLRVVPGFLPPFAWMVFVSALAGLSLLWSVSIWRFVRVPQGV